MGTRERKVEEMGGDGRTTRLRRACLSTWETSIPSMMMRPASGLTTDE